MPRRPHLHHYLHRDGQRGTTSFGLRDCPCARRKCGRFSRVTHGGGILGAPIVPTKHSRPLRFLIVPLTQSSIHSARFCTPHILVTLAACLHNKTRFHMKRLTP